MRIKSMLKRPSSFLSKVCSFIICMAQSSLHSAGSHLDRKMKKSRQLFFKLLHTFSRTLSANVCAAMDQSGEISETNLLQYSFHQNPGGTQSRSSPPVGVVSRLGNMTLSRKVIWNRVMPVCADITVEYSSMNGLSASSDRGTKSSSSQPRSFCWIF